LAALSTAPGYCRFHAFSFIFPPLFSTIGAHVRPTRRSNFAEQFSAPDDAARDFAPADQKPPPIVLDLVERFDRNRHRMANPIDLFLLQIRVNS
jgi:hypothetical protein